MLSNFKVPKNLIPTDPRFGSGPSLVPMEYVKKLYDTNHELLGTSHRKLPIRNLVKEVQDGFRKYFQIPSDYSVVLGNGGATFLFDAIALGIVEEKVTHFTCGEFSEKWFKASKLCPYIKAEQVKVEYGEGINGKDVDGSDLICVTLNETSTGVQLSELPKVHKGALLAVDATSGAGQVPCDISKTDIFYFSPQKVFASDGGLWVAFLSKQAREQALKIAENKSRYVPVIMNWKQAIENSDKNQTYNTPAITTIFYLNEQLKNMNQLGYQKIQEMAAQKADYIYKWAQEKPYLSCYIKDQKFRSWAVATIDLDDKYSAKEIIKILEEQKVAYNIDGYRNLGRNQLRIALFHNITLDNIKRLTQAISMLIES